MGSQKHAKIAQETMKITKQEYYDLNGIRIDIVKEIYKEFDDVIVFDSKSLKAIQEDEDEFFARAFYVSGSCSFYLVDADSFGTAEDFHRPLVMNFANATKPGGGFLSGARGQEESLCRSSTLYASISSDKAREMYEYNRSHSSPIDSDYMLLSPSVCVFRDVDCNLLENPYNVSVFTIPAPNKNGRASSVEQSQLDNVMKERLRKFLKAAARYGYKTLVLGAWGCGAFGHDTKTVAGYFYDLFFRESFCSYFENIVFSILHDQEKIDAFAQVFGDKIENCCIYDKAQDACLYYEANNHAPVCNHTVEIGDENLGYTQGTFMGGTPFEAELWVDDSDIVLQVIIPEREYLVETIEEAPSLSNVKLLHDELLRHNNSVLSTGMVERGYHNESKAIEKYLKILETVAILEFSGIVRNGCLHYLTDIEGNNLVAVIVSLIVNNVEEAKTSLTFRDFPVKSRKHALKVIK